MTQAQWYLVPINPVGWKTPPFSPGRRNGKLFVASGANQELVAYQEAVREHMGSLTIDVHKYECPVKLKFFFWRQVSGHAHPNDATNMQKATEDALQGVLYDNDSIVADVRSVTMEQGPEVSGRVLIRIEPFLGIDPDEIPTHIWNNMEKLEKGYSSQTEIAEYMSDDNVRSIF